MHSIVIHTESVVCPAVGQPRFGSFQHPVPSRGAKSPRVQNRSSVLSDALSVDLNGRSILALHSYSYSVLDSFCAAPFDPYCEFAAFSIVLRIRKLSPPDLSFVGVPC